MLCDNPLDLSHFHAVDAPWYYVPFCPCRWFYTTIYFVISLRSSILLVINSTFLVLRDDTFASGQIPQRNSTIQIFLSFFIPCFNALLYTKSSVLRHKTVCSTKDLRCNAIHFFFWFRSLMQRDDTFSFVQILRWNATIRFCFLLSLVFVSTFCILRYNLRCSRSSTLRQKAFCFTQNLLCYELFLFCLRSFRARRQYILFSFPSHRC